MHYSIVHRALVTYSDKHTGEIRVKIPAVTGQSEVTISKIGRSSFNSLWVVPEVGEQITVSADDHLMTNVFWIQTDGYVHTKHYRNYFVASDTLSHSATVTGGVGDALTVTYNNGSFSEGISLVNSSKITFAYEGVYNFQYSAQFSNTDSQDHDAVVWFAYNGSPHPESATHLSVPSKHGSVNGTAVLAINFIDKLYENDHMELMWAANDTHVSLATISNGATFPATVPSSPSMIVTVTQVA